MTGNPIALRFPGQWFQSESGLHQNWMRGYDPNIGRYIQADPLGLPTGTAWCADGSLHASNQVALRGEGIVALKMGNEKSLLGRARAIGSDLMVAAVSFTPVIIAI